MVYTVLLAREAEQDILQIKNYIKNILCSFQACGNFEKALFKTLKTISMMPHSFSVEVIQGIIYRKALINKYVALFRIDEQSHTVHIIAIGYSLQKRKNIIKKT